MTVNKNDLFASLPPEWPEDVLPEIQRRLKETKEKVVVLDDDPTGTQTVHGIPVLTEWSVESLAAELNNDLPAFYILTNSRALLLPQAQALNAEIGQNLHEAARRANRPFAIISRSDSTLRGHFPGEVDALVDAISQQPFDPSTSSGLRAGSTTHRPPYLIIPAFFAGGRYTINDVHYVAYGDELIPAGETEFARDASFGYRASNLRDWVEEKTGGRVRANEVASITLADIRRGGPTRVADKLAALSPNGVCIVNATSERDLEVVALASLIAESQGHTLLYRTAASFARARAGIPLKPLLTKQDLPGLNRGSGLIVVGSYVPKTSGQLEALLQKGVNAIEVNVEAVLDDTKQQDEIARATQQANDLLSANKDAVIYTSRKLITGADAASSLVIGQRVSDSLIAIMRGITVQPRYVLAKGGITSSDVATKALNVKRAIVLGQLLPGVPVWKLGSESCYPDLIYVVFPGNVGGPDALAEAVGKLKG